MIYGLFGWILFTGLYLEIIAFQILRINSLKRSAPENVSDLYGRRSYMRWSLCQRHLCRFNMLLFSILYALLVLIFLTDISGLLTAADSIGLAVLQGICSGTLVFICHLITACRITIKKNYGLCQQDAKKTVREGILAFAISFCLYIVYYLCMPSQSIKHSYKVSVSLPAVILCCLVFLSVRYFFKVIKQNRQFLPVSDQDLSDKLHQLAQACGENNIEFQETSFDNGYMEAAVYSVFHRNFIVFSKALINSLDHDCLCAIAVHEIGHVVHRHLLHMHILKILCTGGIIILLWSFFGFVFSHSSLSESQQTIHELWLLFEMLIGTPVFIMIKNRLCQLEEKQADLYAQRMGFGINLVNALKLSERDAIRELNPHPLLLLLTAKHPSLSQRIAYLESENTDCHTAP